MSATTACRGDVAFLAYSGRSAAARLGRRLAAALVFTHGTTRFGNGFYGCVLSLGLQGFDSVHWDTSFVATCDPFCKEDGVPLEWTQKFDAPV